MSNGFSYNQALDIIVWQSEEISPKNLYINIRQYNNGEPKIEFVRNTYQRNGEMQAKTGTRWFIEDYDFIMKWLPRAAEKIHEIKADPNYQAMQAQRQQQYQQRQQQNQQNPNQQFQQNPQQQQQNIQPGQTYKFGGDGGPF